MTGKSEGPDLAPGRGTGKGDQGLEVETGKGVIKIRSDLDQGIRTEIGPDPRTENLTIPSKHRYGYST